LLEAIREFERQRIYLSDEDRATYFIQAREAFDALISLEVEQGQTASAFIHVEQARARVLLDRLLPSSLVSTKQDESPVPRLSLNELLEMIPEGVRLVEYVVLKDRLLIFVIGKKEFHLVTQVIGESELRDLVTSLTVNLETKTAIALAQLSRLHDEILFKARPYIREGDLLVFVPDKMLYSVPFAALRTPGSRFLIEDFPIAIAPSVSVYLEGIKMEEKASWRRKSRILIIANPTRDSQNLPALSETEALRIASLYPASEVRLLKRNEASKSAFLSTAGQFGIIHFGGHSIANVNFPALSYLLMASNRRGDGPLYAFQIATLRLERTHLVVLASCYSGSGFINDSEGLMSLGRAFISAGVPVVVDSLWAVDDRQAGWFFAEFYNRLRTGESPASALRSSQLKALDKCRGDISQCIRNWFGFQVVGGVTNHIHLVD